MAGPLANPRREQFCLLFVQGKTPSQAYMSAGYNVCGKRSEEVSARRLLRDPVIHRRVAELQRQAAESSDITVATLLRECADIQRDAMRKHNHSAAVSALTAKAKLAGHWIERTETENVHLNYTICDVLPSEQQWEAERIERQADLPAITNHKASDEKP